MTDDLATEDLKPVKAAPAGASPPPPPEPPEPPEVRPAAVAGAPAVDFDEALLPDPNEGGRRRPLLGLALCLAFLTLFGTLGASGIWDPHELKVADLARRIAVNLLGASDLVVAGGVNTVPTAGELGRGELPFTSVALSMRFFGLSEWAGRLPMALWGLVCLLASYLFVSRLVDRVAAAFTVIVLATSPLFFLQSRTILGDVAAMAGLALSVAGLSMATFDARPGHRARVLWALAGAVGLFAGFGSRGVVVGVALPALSVGLASLLRRGTKDPDRLGVILGWTCLTLGVSAAIVGLVTLLRTPDHQFSRLLGGTLSLRPKATPHDTIIHQLGHATLPWSAVIPFALGRMLLPPVGAPDDSVERESSARLVVALASVLGFAVYTALAPHLGVMPFGAVFALAAATGIAFRDLERGAPYSRVLVLGVAALLILFYTDFKNFPEKGLSAFAIDDAKFPDSFKERGTSIVKYGAVGTAALFALFLFEREEKKPAFARSDYRAYLVALRTVYDGNVAFALRAAEASLVVLAVLTVVSDRVAHWAPFETMSVPLRNVARYGWFVLPLAAGAPLLALLARDACRWLFRLLKVTRPAAALLAVAAFGATLSFVYYPSLARQISPREVFDSFRRLSRPGEELGMMGGGTGTARYYAQRDVRTFASSTEAFSWLTEKDDVRRWLVVRATDIGQMNSQFRGRRAPAKNLPVLDARSSEILLTSNMLRPSETNENPFARWVLDRKPSPSRPLDIDFNGQLRGMGWDVTTPEGENVQWVRSGKPYLFRFYYEVTRAISGDWQTFIHVDGYQRRYNGDHDTLEGKYAFHLWRIGDYVVDIHRFELEPNFTAGTYTVFYGLFRGEQRLSVKRGPAEADRVTAGPLVVR